VSSLNDIQIAGWIVIFVASFVFAIVGLFDMRDNWPKWDEATNKMFGERPSSVWHGVTIGLRTVRGWITLSAWLAALVGMGMAMFGGWIAR